MNNIPENLIGIKEVEKILGLKTHGLYLTPVEIAAANIQLITVTTPLSSSGYTLCISLELLKDALQKLSTIFLEKIKTDLPLSPAERYFNELQAEKTLLHSVAIQRLSSTIPVEIEVECPLGRIDAISKDYVIEVKPVFLWKHGVGQVNYYSQFYPNKKKRVHLFGARKYIEDRRLALIDFCNQQEILLSFDDLLSDYSEYFIN